MAGRFFLVAPGESKSIPDRGNPRWSTKKYSSPFGGEYFFPVAPGESKFIPGRGNPRWSTKRKKPVTAVGCWLFLYLSMVCWHGSVKNSPGNDAGAVNEWLFADEIDHCFAAGGHIGSHVENLLFQARCCKFLAFSYIICYFHLSPHRILLRWLIKEWLGD